jgi:hypothetical protein
MSIPIVGMELATWLVKGLYANVLYYRDQNENKNFFYEDIVVW